MPVRMTIDAGAVLSGGGGISNYVCPLLKRFCADRPADIRCTFHWRVGSPERYRRAQALLASGLPGYPNVQHCLARWPDRVLDWAWRRRLAPLANLSLPPGDVYLGTTALMPRHGDFRRIAIVYDIMQVMIPQFFAVDRTAFIADMRRLCAACDAVIAISQQTARDLEQVCDVPPEKLTVIYPGLPEPQGEPQGDAAALAALGVKPPYLLYLGALALNKNVDGLVRAFARFVRLGFGDWQLVMTGRDFLPPGFLRDLIQAEGVADRVRVVGWIPDTSRWALLRRAELVVTLSWYEGFGLPVIEAMSTGTPVLVSNRSSLPEVLPFPAQQVDPEDPAVVARRLAEFARSPEMRATWRRNVQARAADFDWGRSAAILRELVERQGTSR